MGDIPERIHAVFTHGFKSNFILFYLLLFIFPGTCFALPKLNTTVNQDNSVRVQWSISRREAKAQNSKLIIERKTAGGLYKSIAIYDSPNRYSNLIEYLPEGTYSYRARHEGLYKTRKRKKRRRTALRYKVKLSSVSTVKIEDQNPVQSFEEFVLPANLTKCSESLLQALDAEVNSLRVSHGVHGLERSPVIDNAALEHSAMMAEQGQISHDGWLELILAAWQGTSYAQNIALFGNDVAGLVNGWYNSPGHRDNLIADKFTYTGYSCVIDPAGRMYWTHYFTN